MSNHVGGWVPCRAMAASHLSPQAYERLREELAWRTGEYRREISLADRTRARARRHQRERRLRRGEGRAGQERSPRPPDRADPEDRGRRREARPARSSSPGASSSSATRATTTPQTYLVGSIEERDETYDVLSPDSPLGQALLGAAPGTSVTYQGPRRELSVTVVAVRPRLTASRTARRSPGSAIPKRSHKRAHVAVVVEVRLVGGVRPHLELGRATRHALSVDRPPAFQRADFVREAVRVRTRRSRRATGTTTSRSTRCTSTSRPVVVDHHEVAGRARVGGLRPVARPRVITSV